LVGHLAVGAIAAAGNLTGTQAQTVPDMGAVIQQIASQFTALAATLLSTVDSTVVLLARLAYISVLLIGLLLYFTHLERRLGKDLIKGGVILAVLCEFVFPMVVKV
jgi:hypothetical protein